MDDNVPESEELYDAPVAPVDIMPDGAPRPLPMPRAGNSILMDYRSTLKGRLAISTSTTLMGATWGALLGQAILSRPQFFAKPCALVCFLLASGWVPLRGNARLFIPWIQSLGLTWILFLHRSRSIRRTYATGPYLSALLGRTPRRRYPSSTPNPWRVTAATRLQDAHFRMLPTLLAMALVGGVCGGTLPLLPTWLGGLVGAVTCAYTTTLRTPRGDLCRIMGMRVVAGGQTLLQVLNELDVPRQTGVVTNLIMGWLLILDRQHKIKDRLIQAAAWVYAFAMRRLGQLQRDYQQSTAVPEPRSEGVPRRRPPSAGAVREDETMGRRYDGPEGRPGEGAPRRRGPPPPDDAFRRPPPRDDPAEPSSDASTPMY
jgi:hypothetical protein